MAAVSRLASTRGGMTLPLLVTLVPVVFGIMGFALDLGRIYMVRGELTQATQSIALAAAQQLIGTSASQDNANSAATLALDDSTGHAPRFNFGSQVLGTSGGLLTSALESLAFYAASADATGTSGNQADATTARHVQVTATADAPLLFWGILSVGAERKITVTARSVAGISAPLCTACGIMPIAVARLDDGTDTTNFGFTASTQYTFAFECTASGNTTPTVLSQTDTAVVQYGIVNRDKVSTLDFSQNLYRIGAGGLIPSTSATQSCLSIGGSVSLWSDSDSGTNVVAASCTAAAPPLGVTDMLCGMDARFESSVPETCTTNVTDAATLVGNYTVDTDLSSYTDSLDYTGYTGNTRRIITVAIVDTLATDATGTMTILGFRQFLVEPTTDTSSGYVVPSDRWGRFSALYIGSVVPVRQGWVGDVFSLGACSGISGPGKVVLYQ